MVVKLLSKAAWLPTNVRNVSRRGNVFRIRKGRKYLKTVNSMAEAKKYLQGIIAYTSFHLPVN